jgi:hypothetical protein
MPKATAPAHQPGDFFTDCEKKVFPDVEAEPGEKASILGRFQRLVCWNSHDESVR